MSVIKPTKVDYSIENCIGKFEHIGFLDIDGVLQNNRTYMSWRHGGALASHFMMEPEKVIALYDRPAIDFLARLSYKVGIMWVMSSSHRIILKADGIRKFSELTSIPIVDFTRSLGSRSEEIDDWLDRFNCPGKVIVLDDDPVEDLRTPDVQTFQIDPIEGITFEMMGKISKYMGIDVYDLLNRNWTQPLWKK